MEQDSNLEIWNQVCETDPEFVKTVKKRGGFSSIDPVYTIKRATEIFGPTGIGWGYEILESRMSEGAPIYNGSGVLIGKEILHTIRIKLWYIWEGKKGEFEQFGHTPFVTKGLITDEDPEKKSLTDAIKKGLSFLGFSADIFEGKYGDQEYVKNLSTKYQIEKAEDRQDEIAKAEIHFEESVKDALKLLEGARSANTLKALLVNQTNKLTQRAITIGRDPEKVNKLLADRAQELHQKLKPSPKCDCGESLPEQGEPCQECGLVNKETN